MNEIFDDIPEENRKIAVNFTYSLQEYTDAYRLYFAQLQYLKVNIFIALGLIILGVFICLIYGYSYLNFAPTYIALLICAYHITEYFLIPIRNYKGDARLKEIYNIVFTKEKILYGVGKTTVALNWQQYHKWSENDDFFLLFYSETFLIIPKRILTEEETITLRSMILANIPEHSG